MRDHRHFVRLTSVIALLVRCGVGCGGNDHGSGEVAAGNGTTGGDHGTASDRGVASDPATVTDPAASGGGGGPGSCVAACKGGGATCATASACGADRGEPGVCLTLCRIGGHDCPGSADCVGQGANGAQGICLQRCQSVDTCTPVCGTPLVARQCAPLGATKDGPSSGPSYCLYVVSVAGQNKPDSGG